MRSFFEFASHTRRQALFGRLLLPEEDKPGKPQVVILSYRLWKRLFSADPQIVGKSITLSGEQ